MCSKVSLKTGVTRIRLHKLKKEEQLQKEKSEILELIKNGKIEIARIKVCIPLNTNIVF